MLHAATFGGQGGELTFQNAPGLEHLPRLETVEGAEEVEGRLSDLGGPIGDEGADTRANVHHSHGREIANAGTQAGSADAQPSGKFAFGRYTIAGLQFTGLD